MKNTIKNLTNARISRCVLVFCFLSLFSTTSHAQYREFKDTNGNTIQAKVLEVAGDKVSIERSDGKKFTVAISLFSTADQQFIRNFGKPQPAGGASGWLQFRGSNFNHTSEKNLPTSWSATENVAWRAELPGPGSSSPIVVGDRVLITCYTGYGLDKTNPGNPAGLRRHLYCFDRATGATKWKKDIASSHNSSAFKGYISLHGFASNTPCSDGQRVFGLFGNAGVHAFDLDGKPLWNVDVGAGTDGFGSGGSPIMAGGMLIVNASIEGKKLLALNPANGQKIWEAELLRAFSTPIAFDNGGKIQIAATSERSGLVGFDAKSGRKVWELGGFSHRYTCASPVFADGIVYGTGSVDGPLAAVRPNGQEVWRGKNFKTDVTSPIYHNGRVIWINGNIYTIFDAKTGSIIKQSRTPWPGDAGVYATPLIAGDHLYLQSQFSGTWVAKIGDEITEISHNQVERERPKMPRNGSPVAFDGKLFLRTNKALYCIGK